MSNPILSDIIGQYGEFFKATDKFFNKIAAYSERILEETEKIPNILSEKGGRRFFIIQDLTDPCMIKTSL